MRWFVSYLCDSLQAVWAGFPTRLVGLEDLIQQEGHRIVLREQMVEYLEKPEIREAVGRNLKIITRQEYEASVGSETYRLHTQMSYENGSVVLH